MKRYLVHPLQPRDFTFVPNTNVVAALIDCGAGTGTVQLLLPDVAAPLRNLFEKPQHDDAGQTLTPWSPEALDFLLETALPRIGWVAVEVA